MNSIGDILVGTLMLILFPVLIPVILMLMVYWMVCSVVYVNKKEVDYE